MTLKLEDTVSVNVVLPETHLLTRQNQLDNFLTRLDVDSEVQRAAPPPFPVTNPPDESTIVLLKERLALSRSSNPKHTVISQEYPADEFRRLAVVTNLAIHCSDLAGQPIPVFAVNVASIFLQQGTDGASVYIARKLLAPGLWKDEGWEVDIQTVQPVFRRGPLTLTFRIEPRTNDLTGKRVFVGLNVLVAADVMPTPEELWNTLELARSSLMSFADSIG